MEGIITYKWEFQNSPKKKYFQASIIVFEKWALRVQFLAHMQNLMKFQ